MDIIAALESFDKIITTTPGLQISITGIVAGLWYIVPLTINDGKRAFGGIVRPLYVSERKWSEK